MISVIVCSINKIFAEQLEKNINNTIGVPWELILIDNNKVNASIASVYNMGASRARYELLCFVHEDVLFKDRSWGKTLESLFQNNPELGVVGVAGSRYKSRVLSGWYTGVPDFDCCNIAHLNERNEETIIYANPNPQNNVQQVISLDGVFICARKTVWDTIRFNETLLKGFHCYDIDFSVRAARHYQVAVTYEINLIHLTEGGSFGNNWIDSTILWHQSYQNILPLSIAQTPVGWRMKEVQINRNWLIRLKPEPISLLRKIKWILKTNSLFHIQVWPAIVMFLFFRLYKKLVAFPASLKR